MPLKTDFIDVGLPRESRGITKVKRDVRVDYIGDTNGSYPGFLFNAKKLGLIDESGDWIGGKRHLVILGDIFGDRNMESFSIARHVNKLIGLGAMIDCLAGNHDDMALAYLDQEPVGRNDVGRRYLQCGYLSDEGPRIIDIFKGVQEFGEFSKDFQGHTSWQQVLFRTKPHDILSKMRNGEKGQEILRFMCNFQIGKILDDTLFIHTDPVDAMVDIIGQYDWDIEKINTVIRSFLVQTLREGNYSDTKTIQKAREIRRVFLDTDNRRHDDNHRPMLSETKAETLKNKLKIRRIIHGHTNHHFLQTIYRGGIEITSADNSSFKQGDITPGNTYISAGSILSNGHRIAPQDETIKWNKSYWCG